MTSDIDITPLKQSSRVQASKIRDAIPESQRLENSSALLAFDLLPLCHDYSKVIAGYYPIRSELDCLPLLEKLRDQGFSIALPIVLGDDKALSFKAWTLETKLIKGRFGILIPDEGAKDLEPDVVLVPLLAFDRQGTRLGYGKGHYDRTLEHLKKHKEVISVGIAYNEQEFEKLPCDDYDQKLDWILTPSGLQKLGE